MKKIKFRAFFKGYKNAPDFNAEEYNQSNKMVYDIQDLYDGSGTSDPNIAGGYTHFGEIIDSDDFVVMQFTGIKDKYGKDIYEGDIVKGVFGGISKERIGVITYETEDIYPDTGAHEYAYATGFHIELKYCFQGLGDRDEDIEVIGNIYENKDLLE